MRKIPKYNSPEYWKTADTYRFKMNDNENFLEVYAHSPRNAKLKAIAHGKWLKRTGRGSEKALLDTIKKMLYRK